MTVYLVDKSAWEWARRDPRAEQDFTDLARGATAFAACHLTAMEIGYSARNQADHAHRIAGQQALQWLPVTEAAMDRALSLQSELAATGRHRTPLPDLIIAATAETHGATVLHVDKDFDLIAEITGQPMRRLATG